MKNQKKNQTLTIKKNRIVCLRNRRPLGSYQGDTTTGDTVLTTSVITITHHC